MSKKVPLYLHKAQQYYIAHPAKIKVIVAGRGWAKTTSIGILLYNCMVAMRGSRGFIVGLTYNQIVTKFLPPMFKIWGKIGCKEYDEETDEGDFVFGKKPPAWFEKPIQAIKNYKNIISFRNGSF